MRSKSKYAGPWGYDDNLYSIKTGEWRYQRPVTKAGKCCQCGTCYIFCPTGCITDRGTHFAADMEYCKGCGLCVKVCPVSAIAMVREER